MRWKSTIDLNRREAVDAIIQTVVKTPYDDMSNEELEQLMYDLDIGDDPKKPYFGFNFNING